MRPRSVLSAGNFFFGIQTTLVLYVLFPYLETLLPAAQVGLVVSGGALTACIIFFFLPRLVQYFGVQHLAVATTLLEAAALFLLAAAPGVISGVIFAALTVAFQPILAFQMDLLLEATVEKENTTGRVRTLFITAWNVAALAAPPLMGALLADGDAYGRVFLAGAALSLPIAALFAFRTLPTDGIPKLTQMRETLMCILRNRDLAAVTIGHQLLYFFFVWGPFYIPLYLHSVLGIPWSTLGWVFTVMLIPYAIIEYPAGWLADKKIGDKELMFAGFLICGAGLASLAFLTVSTPLWIILLALVATRIGAALIESMTEGHFFRRVSERDINTVSIFRAAWPLGDLVAPLIGSAILLFGNYSALFLITGGFLALGGTATTFLIKDVR